MKNLKKVLALVLALSMILSTFTALTLTASAAAQPKFSDIAGTSYEDAVEVLAALGIVAGYEDGTFGGDKVVTRAEMAAFIVRSLGLSAASTGISNYTDVAADHWAIGSIDIASNKKIVVGNGDGTFNPDAQVTYEAAVKMLVCALGYEVRAVKQGGWPTGYVIEGAAIGLTDGITGVNGTDGCNRGIVAALLYNALEIELMEETSFSNNNASIMEQTNKTLLWDNLKVIKYYDADITATPTQGANKTAAGTMKISGLYDDYGYTKTDKARKLEIGETNPDDFFGNTVIVYAKYNGSNKTQTALCILNDTSAQDSVEIAVADFYGSQSVIKPGEKNTEGTNNSKYFKLYYKTEEDTKAQYVSLLDSDSYYDYCSVVVNGVVNPDNFAGWEYLDELENGTIQLIDAKTFDVTDGKEYAGADGIYEKVIIDTYFDFVVAETDVEEGIIVTQNGVDITLDESKVYAITDAEGNELKLEDIKENDVLSVYCDQINKADVDSSEVLSIVVYNAPIEGTVTEKTAKAIYIDDTKYKLAGELVALDDFDLDDAGTFYLNAAGDIVYADTTAAAKDYAVLYRVRTIDDGYGISVSVKTAAGEDLVLTNDKELEVVTYGMSAGEYVRLSKDEYDFDMDGQAAAAKAALEPEKDGAYAPYIITYSAKDGVIETIYMAGEITNDFEKPATRFAKWYSGNAYYNKSENTFGPYAVDSSTIIFDIPESVTTAKDADKIKVVNKGNLTNNKTYSNVTVYEVDKNNTAKAAIMSSSADSANVEDPIAIVQSISRVKDAEGEDIYKIYMIENGKVITKSTVDAKVIEDFRDGAEDSALKAEYSDYSLKVAYDLYAGSVIIYSDDASGAIDSFMKLYPTTSVDADEDTGLDENGVPYYRSEFFTTWNNSAEQNWYTAGCDLFIIYGEVTEKNATNKSITIATQHKTKDTNNEAADAVYTANYGTANVTVVDFAFEEDADRVSVGTASDIKARKLDAEGNVKENGSYVLVRKRNGATKDIVVYRENFVPAFAK